MTFPLELTSNIQSSEGRLDRKLTLNHGLTILLGPNGSGKTHLLRGLKSSLGPHINRKHVRFLSAGRMGLLEQYRSDFDGHRGTPRYEEASYGGKSEAARRHKMETLTGDFHTLAERADILIKIQERLRKLFQRDVLIDWDGGVLKVSFSRLSVDAKPYSSGREASGLMHLVGILAALYDDEVGALLLDEPEVSLHPQLQAFLLKEILSIAGDPATGENKKIIIIATHSTEMLQIRNPEDLLSLVFCYDLKENPVQIPRDAGELQNKKLQNLIARLGQEHKLALFSRRPLLVEGPSDVIICSALSNCLDIHLEAAGSQLLPVIGKGQMPTVAKLMQLLGKEPISLADADGVADGVELINSYLAHNKNADTIASSHGFASAQEMATSIYSHFCKLVETRWTEISAKAESHPFWINKKEGDELLAKRRSAFCTLFLNDTAELSRLAADNSWANIAARIAVLLDLLEQCGLFILRKGTIESYYQSNIQMDSIGKPSAAVSEIEQFTQLPRTKIEVPYSDVIRCISYASNSYPIDEAEALRDLLLSIVAPAHARLKIGTSQNNLNLLARSILGERSKIFGLDIEGDKLVVSIKSKILDVAGFPIALGKDDDVAKCIDAALLTKYR